MKKMDKWIKQSNMGNPPKWCNHIKFWSRNACECDGIEFPPQGGWTFLGTYSFSGCADTWKFCPMCGKKQPKS